MEFMVGAWIALSAAIIALSFTKQTRMYEVVFLGGWGILTGAMLAGATSFGGLSIGSLWAAIF
ncbi:hypothetical protein [Streptosporangium roseum]|uniref:hypothetical protein n=1 Tax=Streptosporangium roseum TaxID=2001 RepID=UPI0004CC9C64|nr:hypothetical protein [Streptosporangium roseum]